MSRSVLVTGGGRGIGLAVARAFADAGDKVAVTYRTSPPPDGLFGVRCDVTDQRSVDRAYDEVTAQHGPVQVLVSNAGITRDNLFLGMEPEDFDAVLDTNFGGGVRVTRRALLDMASARWGRVILIGSAAGMMGSAGVSNYAAAKSAMIGFARSLAHEVATRRVTVNVVAPGLIETDLVADLGDRRRAEILAATPIGRPGRPEEVAGIVRFLAGDEASYITGAVIPVSGGYGMGH
ncbi:3-oxoacyl-ACP reductase FabG [Streptomyces triticirhizae]|uniref:SDR family oxidoreductase n=1 Tax=Streptomyces triticirhizae TaxID=2483353 RepID=A0A3M2M6K3_9ACTN|nr:3-oxoacyl-ACP reductase FabG [Streptomyces triticirhizae]RMI45181.1 SDR family oxidoreductase [Streptomyces triticirhizae]